MFSLCKQTTLSNSFFLNSSGTHFRCLIGYLQYEFMVIGWVQKSKIMCVAANKYVNFLGKRCLAGIGVGQGVIDEHKRASVLPRQSLLYLHHENLIRSKRATKSIFSDKLYASWNMSKLSLTNQVLTRGRCVAGSPQRSNSNACLKMCLDSGSQRLWLRVGPGAWRNRVECECRTSTVAAGTPNAFERFGIPSPRTATLSNLGGSRNSSASDRCLWCMGGKET